MRRGRKIALGVASIWPLAFVPIYLAGFFFIPGWAWVLYMLLGLCVLTMAEMLVVSVYLAFDALKLPNLGTWSRVIWAALLLSWGMITAPIYWYLHVWKRPSDEHQ